MCAEMCRRNVNYYGFNMFYILYVVVEDVKLTLWEVGGIVLD